MYCKLYLRRMRPQGYFHNSKYDASSLFSLRNGVEPYHRFYLGSIHGEGLLDLCHRFSPRIPHPYLRKSFSVIAAA